MTQALLSPPLTPAAQAVAMLQRQGYAVLGHADVCAIAGCAPDAPGALNASWDRLPPDAYLKDGGHYRRRRHSCFIVDGAGVTQAPHRAHWQPLEYNALHGGMHRWFEPIEPQIVAQPAWAQLLGGFGRLFTELRAQRAGDGGRGKQPWYVEAHQFRIDTTDGIGRPTPEGAHRDGVDYVAVFLVARTGVKGGETRVFEADGPHGERFTLTEPWSVLLLDDARVIHESTPIQPLQAQGSRDTLVLTWRSDGFMEEQV
ncbi:MAG: hypothetical protein OJF60_001327 [Burkholderiaceae bacterium]|jgi:hypothetical protein|nr:MAG: hypothetical protein OJF60_001327 [Burkholderiaceae bacterium]